MSTTATTTATPKDNASKRDAMLQEIERGLKMKVIAYLTGDRPGLETQIGGDVIVRFRRHLEAIGDIGTLGLFLYTRGGDTNVPWRLVTLLREYCEKLVVFVPMFTENRHKTSLPRPCAQTLLALWVSARANLDRFRVLARQRHPHIATTSFPAQSTVGETEYRGD